MVGRPEIKENTTVFLDDFHRELWFGVARFAFGGQAARAERLLHLTRGYAAGVDQSEVLERIGAGELDV